MKRGTAVRCIIDYDLFDVNINGKKGCLIKYDPRNEKYLIRFDCNEEWAELKNHEFELVHEPEHISEEYKSLIQRIETLKITF